MSNGATGESAQVAGRQVAGKTGTSNNDWDAWFMGYTPQLGTAIWHGHTEGQISMINSVINGVYYYEVYGGLFPAQVFSSYLTQALADQPAESFTPPSRNVLTSPYVSKPSNSSSSSNSENSTSEDSESSDHSGTNGDSSNDGGGSNDHSNSDDD